MKILNLILVLLVLLLAACSQKLLPVDVAPREKQLVELSDMFQTGHARFLEALEEDSLLQAVWMNRASQLVMVLIDIVMDDGEKEQVQQTGVLVGSEQLVLTAGHGFIVDEGRVVDVLPPAEPQPEL